MSYEQYRPNKFSYLPLVVKNLLIINGLFFLATLAMENQGIHLEEKLGLYFPLSENFQPYQLVTYMFMHGGFMHLFFNMFALWMFGNTLENLWGPKRFLIYYMVTGIGAALIQMAVTYFRIMPLMDQISAETLNVVLTNGSGLVPQAELFAANELYTMINMPTVGASGSVFGILLAFGMLFPNTLLYIYFAIPIKAKWFVIAYGAMELFSGIANNPGDNVAHFAHLGGMLFGFILIKIWQKRSNRFY